ncbi:FAD-dependent monooxygenase [uncultured Chryseobacterium sp.]|uniref:FAD-dependent oxidoreductase n=1 Tax=uncultured Chryseobacterium sp. TaxID=259322 RepID=UPI0025F51C20|nr:FAD-dependent monooxygenase [uncultured Chryseobacterium sp.]
MNNCLLQNKKVAVVGGGPGGLILARLLQLKGCNINVYERDKSQRSRVQGAIVDLHFESGLKAIKAAGLMDAFKNHYMVGADKFRLVDPGGRILIDEERKISDPDFTDEHFRPEIDRGALRDIIIDVLKPGTVIWDSHLINLKPLDGGWALYFKNGKSAEADLVIGADGYRSLIRPYLTDIKAHYSGATIIQGEIDQPETDCPEMYKMADQANLMVMGQGSTLVVQPRGDGGLTFHAISLYPENWITDCGIDFKSPVAVRKYLTTRYKEWNPVFFTLFRSCYQFTPRPLNYYPFDQKWKTVPNLTILGDAAHLMPPNGEGVNLAMLDALDLSDYLTSGQYKNLYDAINAYEKLMLERSSGLCRESVEGIADFAAPSADSINGYLEIFNKRPK